MSEVAASNDLFSYLDFAPGADVREAGEIMRGTGVCVLRSVFPPEFIDYLKFCVSMGFDLADARSKFFGYTGLNQFRADFVERDFVLYREILEMIAPLGFHPHGVIEAAVKASPVYHAMQAYFQTSECDTVQQLMVARRQRPKARTSVLPFHQDVANYVHASFVNLWVPLIACGQDAASLELVPVATDELLSLTSRSDSLHPTVEVDEETVFSRFGSECYRPVLAPGDVVLFNQHTIHRTYMPPAASQTRLSIEIRMCDHFNPTPY
ncbi:MAG: hypothetical protein EAZ99_12055 [Alphaproteobacteria bacterium]|nr:MAG: hypothetical protein EAZ99_12055 [Alphaproteobacteria bacterium]